MPNPSDLFFYGYTPKPAGISFDELCQCIIDVISSSAEVSAEALLRAYETLFVFRKDISDCQLDELREIFLDHMNWDEFPERDDLKFTYLFFLDCLASYKRPSDIPFLLHHSNWDVYEVSAYQMFLCRKYDWRELWDAFVSQQGRGTLSEKKELLYEQDFNISHEWEMARIHFSRDT